MTDKDAPSTAGTSPAKRQRAPLANGEGLSEAKLRKMGESAYMNDEQLAFFRKLLLGMRQEIVDRESDARQRLHDNEIHADPADRATAEEEYFVDMRLRERESRLLRKIDEALGRIQRKDYGYCEQSGEPIGIPRLLVRPTATVCVDIKDREERLAQSRAN